MRSRRHARWTGTAALVAAACVFALRDTGAPVREPPAGSATSAQPGAAGGARRPAVGRVNPPGAAAVADADPAPAGQVRDPAPPRPPRPGAQVLFPDAAPRPGPLPEVARALLAEHRGELGLVAMPGELRTKREFDTLSGHHLRLEQVLHGVPVFGSEVAAHVAPDGRPLLLHADVFPLEGAVTTPSVTATEAREAVREFLQELADDGPGADLDDAAVETREPRLVLLPEGRAARLVWRVEARTDEESSRVFVDALDGEVVRADDLRYSHEGTGRVFDPNPVFTRRDPSLKDGNDRATPVLNAQTRVVTLPRLDGTGRLVGAWADLTPTLDAPASASLDWTGLTREHPGFEAVMAYFHIDRLQQRLQDLGVTRANAGPQRVDAHALRGDQSYFDYFADLIALGDGGVDDGEDADVILHEYGHALQFDQVADFGLSDEGAAVGEGFGDFLAAAVHAVGDTVYDPLVASWDATSYSSANPPYLRRVDRSKKYPKDFVREVHGDGEIWSRFLWDLRALVGTDDALRVTVESHFFLTPLARFVHAANAVLVANVALRGGRDDASIRALLDARGLQYSVTTAPPPAEDGFEPNNTAAEAAPVWTGTHAQLLLADDDWYRLEVPPGRRLVVTVAFDPLAVNVDLELFTSAGAPVMTSEGLGGVERVEVGAGPGGPVEVLLRVFHGPGARLPAGYDLTVTETDLVALRPGRTELLSAQSGVRQAFRVVVPPEKVGAGRHLRVVAKGRGPRPARRVRPELRVYDPSGAVLVDFGEGRLPSGARARVPADQPGSFAVEVEPRDARSGRYSLKVRLRR
jgi:hypothetical protein